jgi:hypothetical protein
MMWMLGQDDSKHAADRMMRFERPLKTLVTVVCAWSLIEASFEIGVSIDSEGMLSVVLLKFAMFMIGVGAVADRCYARQAFMFICAVSVLAIAPALPIEYGRCVPIALFSTVECIGKGTCATVLAIASMHKGLSC